MTARPSVIQRVGVGTDIRPGRAELDQLMVLASETEEVAVVGEATPPGWDQVLTAPVRQAVSRLKAVAAALPGEVKGQGRKGARSWRRWRQFRRRRSTRSCRVGPCRGHSLARPLGPRRTTRSLPRK